MAKKKTDCVFCKIVNGEVGEKPLYEDEDVVAVLDINPYSKGHLLVIPKKHSRWVWDLSLGDYTRLQQKVYGMVSVLRKAFNTDCVQLAIVGMDVDHTHIHLLPRTKDDGLGGLPMKPMDPKPSDQEMQEIAKKIKDSL